MAKRKKKQTKKRKKPAEVVAPVQQNGNGWGWILGLVFVAGVVAAVVFA